MRKLTFIALAAMTIAGAAVGATASAQETRNHADYGATDQRDHAQDRSRDPQDNRVQDNRVRDHRNDNQGATYEYRRNGCATYWHWSHGRHIRTDRCHH